MSRGRLLAAFLILTSLSLLAASPASAQPRVSGMVFADAQDQLHGTAIPADSSSFRFRRVQLTVEHDLDSVFTARVQLEDDDNELTSRGKSAAFMKQAWLRWGHIGSVGDLYMGLSIAPTWAVAEGVWGYRSLEKTVLDLQGLGSATEMGVALQRAPSATHPLGWHLMLANGNGQKPENTAGKKLMLSLPYRTGDFVIEAMGDFEDERGTADRWTTRALVGWQHANDAAGLELYRRVNPRSGLALADVHPTGVSVYGRRQITTQWRAVARVDFTDPDANRDDAGYREIYYVAALDAMPNANVHVMPNVLVRTYSAKASTLADRKADVTLRVTMQWNYK